MFCGKCGLKSEAGSKFCDQCGAKLGGDGTLIVEQNAPMKDSEVYMHENYTSNFEPSGYHEEDPQPEEPKKKNKKPLIIVVGILLLVAIVATGLLFMGFQNTRAFNDAMDAGNRYLLAENLEQAEVHFLRAIEIDPREVEPYLLLSDIYVTWNQPDRAIEILEEGLNNVAEADRNTIEDRLSEVTDGAPPVLPGEGVESDEDGNSNGSWLTNIHLRWQPMP